MTAKDFIGKIELKAKELGFAHISTTKQHIKIDLSGYIGISFRISIDEYNKPEFSYWFRTDSWHYIDERTDIHDTVSLTFATFLRCLNITSCHLFDVGHPAVPYLDEFEIYARILVPTQLHPNFYKLNDEGIQSYTRLLANTLLFEHYFWRVFGGCPCKKCKKKLGIKYDFKNDLDKRLKNKIFNVIGEGINYNIKDRQLPTWKYYRDFNQQITIIKSDSLAEFFSKSISVLKYEEILGVNGKLFISENIKSFISYESINKGHNILRKLEKKIVDIKALPLDNKALIVGNSFILAFDILGGLQEFKIERDKLRERHNKEFKLLFAPSIILWKTKISDEAFENLIQELLEREPDVSWVRKVAHTNEADGGRDLIATWKVNKAPENLSERESPYTEKKIIVQCKAYARNVGKSDVLDIRDTIEFNNYDGYFLAVSSYLKRSLTDHLDKMRIKNHYWINWWTRHEIEERLKNNPDLIDKYREIFS